MALFSRRPSKISELTNEQRDIIQNMIEAEERPSDIADQLDIPVSLVYYFTRQKPKETPKAAAPRAPSVPDDPEVAKIKAEIEKTRLNRQLEEEKSILAHERELRKLDIEERRIDIAIRRRELLEYDDDDDDDDLVTEDGDINLMPFLTSLLNKPPRVGPQQPAASTPSPAPPTPEPAPVTSGSSGSSVKSAAPDVWSDEQVQEIIAKTPARALKLAKKMNHEQVRDYILMNYQDVSPTNADKLAKAILEQ